MILPDPPPLTPEQQRLVEGTVNLARMIVRRLRRLGGLYARGSEEDMDAAAFLGLCVAASRFDPTRGTAFTTYAGWYIRAFAQEAVSKAGTITLPGTAVRTARRARSAETLELTAAAIHAKRLAPRSGGEGGLEHLASSRSADPAEAAGREEFIARTLSVLPPRERRVIEARVIDGYTLAEVAAEFRVTKERVRQLEARALKKLRAASEEFSPDPY